MNRSDVIDFKNYPVLFVDDEQVALDLFKYNFGQEFTVFTARTLSEAFAILEAQPIALIFCDQRMPGLSGTEFFAQIQRTHPEIIRILVTGYVDLDSVVEAINAGHVYHYFEKPWNDEDLRLAFRRGLEHFHLMRERDRLQSERIDTLQKMARGNRLAAVGTLAAGIAHEIRNPLSAIITFHQMLPEKIQELQKDPGLFETDEFWTRFSKIPLREVERIKNLVQELLDFSRDSGSRYQFKALDLVEQIESVLPMVESELRGKQIHLQREFAADLPEIEMDADKIKQVTINLILNAMHAMPVAGTITLKVFAESNRLVFLVKDTGSGIRPEDVERVFDPFFTTKEPGVGTGLGLTMCHHIIANHGGEITLKSEVDEGTEVKISFPLIATDVALKTDEATSEAAPAASAAETIFRLSDEPDSQRHGKDL